MTSSRHPTRPVAILKLLALAILLFASRPVSADPLTVFSSGGYSTPETISPAPSGFGSFGGDYFIPDFARGVVGNGKIWVTAPSGGPPILFANTPDAVRGGLFLPQNYGANAGRFATFGTIANSNGTNSYVRVYDSSGNSTILATLPNALLSVASIASNNFGPYAGQVLVADQAGRVSAISPNGTVTTVATVPGNPFALTSIPVGFGARAGQVMVDDTSSGRIFSIGANGAVTPFTTVPLRPGQSGLRQMAFSPPGFLKNFGTLLFVSVSGSQFGGGTLGDVVAIDAQGDIVASLRTNLGLNAFDPRGLLFRPDGTLLIADAANDPIYVATAAAFQPVHPAPEPATLLLLGTGMAGIAARARSRRRKGKTKPA